MVLTPTQTVTVTVNWNTNLPNFTGGGAFASLTQGPIASYISSLPPGVPINLNVLDGIFLTAVSPVIAPQNLTRLVWSIYINSTLTPPASGTQAVLADPESNYTCASSGVTVEQG
jgi:hypothetical protein